MGFLVRAKMGEIGSVDECLCSMAADLEMRVIVSIRSCEVVNGLSANISHHHCIEHSKL